MKNLFRTYLAALLDAEPSVATAVIDEALRRGVPPVELIRDVIARGQQRIGDGWEEGSITVACEHAATAVADQALTLLAQSLPAHSPGRRVAFACAEDEWHAMPARLAAAQARAAGLQVTMLGASLPATLLYQHLRASRPDVLALSVTLTANLDNAALSIRAAHRAGVPVVVGGAAWGSSSAIATSLGADLWLGDARQLPVAIEELLARPPAPWSKESQEVLAGRAIRE